MGAGTKRLLFLDAGHMPAYSQVQLLFFSAWDLKTYISHSLLPGDFCLGIVNSEIW